MTPKPQIEKLKTGLAGEYLVAGIMQMKGWISSLTLKNYPGVDIFGMNPDCDDNRVANIQVKTTVDSTFWVGLKYSQRKNIRDYILGPYVFVHLPKTDKLQRQTSTEIKDAEFFILSRNQVIDLIEKTDDAYRQIKREKPLKEDYSIAILLKRDKVFLEPYRDKWENLWISE